MPKAKKVRPKGASAPKRSKGKSREEVRGGSSVEERYRVDLPPEATPEHRRKILRDEARYRNEWRRSAERDAARAKRHAERMQAALERRFGRRWSSLLKFSREKRANNYGLGSIVGMKDGVAKLHRARERFVRDCKEWMGRQGIDPAEVRDVARVFLARLQDDLDLGHSPKGNIGVIVNPTDPPPGKWTKVYPGWSEEAEEKSVTYDGGELTMDLLQARSTGDLGHQSVYQKLSPGGGVESFNWQSLAGLGFWIPATKTGHLLLNFRLTATAQYENFFLYDPPGWASFFYFQSRRFLVRLTEIHFVPGGEYEAFEELELPISVFSGFDSGADLELLNAGHDIAPPLSEHYFSAKSKKKLQAGYHYKVTLLTRDKHIVVSNDAAFQTHMSNAWVYDWASYRIE